MVDGGSIVKLIVKEKSIFTSMRVAGVMYVGFFFFFNWDSLHARLNSNYKAWSYKKRSTEKITGYRKSV